MWANYYPDGIIGIYGKRSTAKYFRGFLAGQITPVAVIPLDDVDALVLKASLAIDNVILCGSVKVIARAALTAIGVLPRAKKGRK